MRAQKREQLARGGMRRLAASGGWPPAAAVSLGLEAGTHAGRAKVAALKTIGPHARGCSAGLPSSSTLYVIAVKGRSLRNVALLSDAPLRLLQATRRLIEDAVEGEPMTIKQDAHREPSKAALDSKTVSSSMRNVIKHAVHEAVDTAERAVKRDVQTQVQVRCPGPLPCVASGEVLVCALV